MRIVGMQINVPLFHPDIPTDHATHIEMAKKRLSEKDIEQLLIHYRSERRRLTFQLEQVKDAIADLRGSEPTTPAKNAPTVKRGPGRPRKAESEKVAKRKKPGRRKKREIKEGGYRLNPWDTMVVETIKKSGLLMTKEDLLKASLAWSKKNEPKLTAEEVETKLTRTLQKLSGKRGELGTHRTGLRRGYHYGIKDWFFASSGKLRKTHYDKLVISE